MFKNNLVTLPSHLEHGQQHLWLEMQEVQQLLKVQDPTILAPLTHLIVH